MQTRMLGWEVQQRLITPNDSEWPGGLRELGHNDPVFGLFLTGQELPDHERAIAVVGTRRPTAAGIDATRLFVRALVQNGFVIISGLAVGIDAIAHRAAIDAGGDTVAVVGAGLDVNYPTKNEILRRDIVDRGGSIASEYSPGTPPQKAYFPARNRIIAGLACGVLVIEGGPGSGALITARRAVDANRKTWALGGSYRNSMAIGPHDLIRSGTATLVTEPKHIFDEIAPEVLWSEAQATGRSREMSADERRVLMLLDDVPHVLDHLARLANLDLGRTAMALSRLEVRGWAFRRSVGYEITEVGARVRQAAEAAV